MELPIYNQPSVTLLSQKFIRNNVNILIVKVEKLDLRRRNNDTSEATDKWIKDIMKEYSTVFNVEVSHQPETVDLDLVCSPKRKLHELISSSVSIQNLL